MKGSEIREGFGGWIWLQKGNMRTLVAATVLYLDCSGGFASTYCPKVIEFYTLNRMKFLMHKLHFNKFDF